MAGAMQGALITFLMLNVVPCLAAEPYQEGYKCFTQRVEVAKGGCKGVVQGSSCADSSRSAEMQREIGKVWFEGKSAEHCKEYFTSACKGVGGTVKDVPEDCSFPCGFPGCRNDADCTDRNYKPVYCCESHSKKYTANCNAVNTATLETLLAEMKASGECSDTECIRTGTASRNLDSVVGSGVAALLATVVCAFSRH